MRQFPNFWPVQYSRPMPPCVRISPSSTVSSPGPTCFHPVRSFPLNSCRHALDFTVADFSLVCEWPAMTPSATSKTPTPLLKRILLPMGSPLHRTTYYRMAASARQKLFDEERCWPLFIRFKFPDPDVAIAHRMTMILQRQRQFLGGHLIGRTLFVPRRPGQLVIVLDEHAIVK